MGGKTTPTAAEGRADSLRRQVLDMENAARAAAKGHAEAVAIVRAQLKMVRSQRDNLRARLTEAAAALRWAYALNDCRRRVPPGEPERYLLEAIRRAEA